MKQGVSCTPNGLLLYYPVASLVDGSRAGAFKRVLGAELRSALAQGNLRIQPGEGGRRSSTLAASPRAPASSNTGKVPVALDELPAGDCHRRSWFKIGSSCVKDG